MGTKVDRAATGIYPTGGTAEEQAALDSIAGFGEEAELEGAGIDGGEALEGMDPEQLALAMTTGLSSETSADTAYMPMGDGYDFPETGAEEPAWDETGMMPQGYDELAAQAQRDSTIDLRGVGYAGMGAAIAQKSGGLRAAKAGGKTFWELARHGNPDLKLGERLSYAGKESLKSGYLAGGSGDLDKKVRKFDARGGGVGDAARERAVDARNAQITKESTSATKAQTKAHARFAAADQNVLDKRAALKGAHAKLNHLNGLDDADPKLLKAAQAEVVSRQQDLRAARQGRMFEGGRLDSARGRATAANAQPTTNLSASQLDDATRAAQQVQARAAEAATKATANVRTAQQALDIEVKAQQASGIKNQGTITSLTKKLATAQGVETELTGRATRLSAEAADAAHSGGGAGRLATKWREAGLGTGKVGDGVRGANHAGATVKGLASGARDTVRGWQSTARVALSSSRTGSTVLRAGGTLAKGAAPVLKVAGKVAPFVGAVMTGIEVNKAIDTLKDPNASTGKKWAAGGTAALSAVATIAPFFGPIGWAVGGAAAIGGYLLGKKRDKME